MPTLNPNEAPDGYYAVLKDAAKRPDGSNICRVCDWRPACQSRDTDFQRNNHRCMDFPVISLKTGQRISRQDGCSVLFKRLPSTPKAI